MMNIAMTKEYRKGERGRIPTRIKEQVKAEINKYGFYMAWHYFAYDCDFGNLTDWEIQTWRAFDQYQRAHEIKEKPLTSSSMMMAALAKGVN
jgi:hypothetical protein